MKIFNINNLNNSINVIFNSVNSNQSDNPSSESEEVVYSPQQILEMGIQYNQIREYLNRYLNENEK